MRTQLVALSVLGGGGILLALTYSGCTSQVIIDDGGTETAPPVVIPDCKDGIAVEGCKCTCANPPCPSETTCYEGPKGTANRGACKWGVRTCTNTGWSKCEGQVLPSPEICDFKDNDCNEKVDDLANEAGAIGTLDGGTEYQCETPFNGVCKAGNYGCSPKDSGPDLVCQALIAPDSGTEECNGLDDDCNGKVDEYLDNLGACDADGGLGECVKGTAFCIGGAVDCKGGTPKSESCNKKDDDCDGKIDNGACSGGNWCCGYGTSVYGCYGYDLGSPYWCYQ